MNVETIIFGLLKIAGFLIILGQLGVIEKSIKDNQNVNQKILKKLK